MFINFIILADEIEPIAVFVLVICLMLLAILFFNIR